MQHVWRINPWVRAFEPIAVKDGQLSRGCRIMTRDMRARGVTSNPTASMHMIRKLLLGDYANLNS